MIFCFPSSFIFSRKVVPSSQIFTFLKANFLVSNDIKKVNHLSPHFFTFCQSFEAPLFIFPFPFTIIIPSIVYVLKNSSLAKLSSHSLLSDISISQSRSKLQFKSTNHIQSWSFNQPSTTLVSITIETERHQTIYASFVSFFNGNSPFLSQLAYSSFLRNCNFLSLIESSFFVLHVVHYFIASIIILNTF